jgi:hypothetical protein
MESFVQSGKTFRDASIPPISMGLGVKVNPKRVNQRLYSQIADLELINAALTCSLYRAARVEL